MNLLGMRIQEKAVGNGEASSLVSRKLKVSKKRLDLESKHHGQNGVPGRSSGEENEE